MGTLGGGRGGVGAWLGRAVRFQIKPKSETKQGQKLMLGSEAKEKIRKGPSCFFSKPWPGEGGQCASEAAPRPEPWSLTSGCVSPAATEP